MAGIPGIVIALGSRFLASKVAGTAVSGAKAAGQWLRGLDLVHALLLAAALFGAWQTFGRWSQHRHAAKVETQLTTANDALLTSRANEAGLKKAIADQNAAIAGLSAKSQARQSIAAKASQVAAQRADEAQATSDRLKQSSRSAPLKSAPACEPSDALKGQWK